MAGRGFAAGPGGGHGKGKAPVKEPKGATKVKGGKKGMGRKGIKSNMARSNKQRGFKGK